MFQGTSFVTLDAKGRLSVPVRHRGELTGEAGDIVATRHPDGCLVLYPSVLWSEKRAQLMRQPHSARALVRLVLGSAVELKLDAAGRILIPVELRRLAGLERDAALVGVGTHLEVWNAAALAAREAEDLAAGLEAADFAF